MSNQTTELPDKATVYEVDGEEVKLSPNIIRNYLVRGNGTVNDQEIVMFLNLCRYQKLNPFLNEAYLVKFGGDAQIIVSKEAFMKRAEGHPQYSGLQAGIIVERDGELVEIEGAVKLKADALIGGWAKIYREDRKQPTTVKIDVGEFGKSQATWKSMPQNMIRKSAIVNAMREAFPERLGAMYSEEEVETAPRDITADVSNEINKNANKETIDFVPENEPVEYKNQRGEVISEEDEVPMSYEEVHGTKKDEQAALFGSLSDVTDESLNDIDPGY